MIRFGRYELDATQGLTHGGQEIRLTPKSLAVLWLLADRAGRVVSKDELFELVWADTAVTDSALATCIQEIRHALHDDARSPRFVETVHRRGYRFIARLSAGSTVPRREAVLPTQAATALFGRDGALDAVRSAFEAARVGPRQVCFIIGEPGIGKSALLGASIAELTSSAGVTATLGQCIEQYGSGEPYQPLLDALMRLCRQPNGSHYVSILERYAPMWLVQLPGLLGTRQLTSLQRTLAGASRDRMLRELTNAVEAMAADEPLILSLEDVHWSDPSTLDWLLSVAQRPESAKLLIVATMRPLASAESSLPLGNLVETLRAKRFARQIVLDGLHSADVEQYVSTRFPPAAGRSVRFGQLARRIHRHTGGNPLFIGTVLDDLVTHGVLSRSADGWALDESADVLVLSVPDSIRPVIERQVANLSPAQRDLLEAASVAGDSFYVSVVARAAGADPDEAESTMSKGASTRFLRDAAPAELPDGSVTSQVAFSHALYREAIYQPIPRGRKAELHLSVGELLESAWGNRSSEIAAELAVHFEQARDFERAVTYLQYAADNARRRSAFNEARLHYERALNLLGRLPKSDATAERELNLRMGLGAATMATRGWGAAEVEVEYAKARSLSQRLGDAPRLFPALWGQWLFYWGRGAVQTAHELATELRTMAEAAEDDDLRLQALHASWATSFSRGQFVETNDYAEQGIGLYESDRHAALAQTYGSHDAGVCAQSFGARALAFLGRPEDAVRSSDDAIALARRLEHPLSIALALTFRAAADQSLRDVGAAAEHAGEAVAVAREQSFALILAWASVTDGWAAVRGGDREAGLRQIRDGIAAARKSGSDQFQPYLLGLLSDACLSAARPAEGLQAVREALAFADRTGERFYLAELHRLHAELMLAARTTVSDAEAALMSALEVARSQGASLLVLRVAVSLCRLAGDAPGKSKYLDLVRTARADLRSSVAVADAAEADSFLSHAG